MKRRRRAEGVTHFPLANRSVTTNYYFRFRKCPQISPTRSRVFLTHSLTLPTPPPLPSNRRRLALPHAIAAFLPSRLHSRCLPSSVILPAPPPQLVTPAATSAAWTSSVQGLIFLAKKPAVLAWTPRSASLGAGSAQERPAVRVCDAGGEMVISASQTQPESVDAGNEVRHWSAEVNDVSLHVAGQGSAAGLVVLLLHGFSEMWLSWSHQMAALAPDLRGRRAPRPPLPPQNAAPFLYCLCFLP